MNKKNPNISIHSHSLALIAEPERIRAARRGEIMHHALGALSALGRPAGAAPGPPIDPAEQEAELERAVLAAFAILDLDPGGWKIAEDFVRPLTKAFGLPQFKAWFREGAVSLRETEIVDARGEVERPDRVVLGQATVEVIDFKVGKREEAHTDQVRAYMDLLKAVFEKARVTGYLVYLDEPAVVEVT
jgi:hypothetical protein